jgi:hypothetical protein
VTSYIPAPPDHGDTGWDTYVVAADTALDEGLTAHSAQTTSAHGGIVGNTDPRLSDARTPVSHATSHQVGQSDALSPASIGAVGTDQLGVPSGVATLDGAGKNVQPPLDHTHNLSVKDNSGTLYTPSILDFLNTSLLNYNSGTGTLTIDLRTQGEVKRIQTATADRSITNSTTTQTASDLTKALVAGDRFDFYYFIVAQSTTAAGFKCIVNAPSGSNLSMNMFGPQASQTSFDSTVLRFPTIDIPTNGPQQFGGFGDASGINKTAVRIEGSVDMPTGTSAGNLVFKFAQTTATSGVTTSLVPFHSKLILVRAA